MAAFSTYSEVGVLNHLLRNSALTSPVTVYIALFTAATGLAANSGVTGEVSGGSYARQAVTFDAPAGANPAVASNAAGGVTFTTASADWGVVSHLAVVDHLTNTGWGTTVNVLFWGALTQSKTVNNGDTFKINAGDLDISLD